MAQSALETANAALIKLGNSTITALSDTSKEATTANARIDVVKKALLRMHPWAFARNKIVSEVITLTVTAISNNAGNAQITITGASDHNFVAGNYVYFTSTSAVSGISGPYAVLSDDSATQFTIDLTYASISGFVASQTTCWKSVAFDWVYLLAAPTSCLRILKVTDSVGNDVDYSVEAGGIATSSDTVYVKYIKDVTDYTLMDTLFYECLSTYLAWDICLQLSQSSEIRDQLWKDFKHLLAQARFVNATEDSQQAFEANDWITARSASTDD